MQLKYFPWWMMALLAVPCRGEDGAAYLAIAPTARVETLGQTGSLTRGGEAVFYNPAGLSELEGSSAYVLTQAELHGEARYNAVGAAINGGEAGNFGVGLLAVAVGGLDGRDNIGAQTGSFRSMDASLGASWGRSFGLFAAGAGLKLLRRSIADVTASGWSADAGLQSRLGELDVAASVSNIGPGIKFYDVADPLPLALRLGASGAVGPCRFFGEATDRPNARTTSLGAGIEVGLGRMVFLRTGVLHALGENRTASGSSVASRLLSEMAFGMGLKLWNDRLAVDYSAAPGGDLPLSHKVTLSFKFPTVPALAAKGTYVIENVDPPSPAVR